MSRPIPNRAPQPGTTRCCRHCGATFEAVRHQAFCAPACRWEYFKAKRENGGDVEADLFRQAFE